MNFLNILQDIEKADPEFADRISPRRAAIKNITSFGSKIAVSAVPFALGTLFQKAYGQQTPAQVNDVLNFALTLEYLEAEFYTLGNASLAFTSGTAGNAAAAGALKQIEKDENAHVAFLKGQLGASANPKPTFDFTAKDTFPTVFSSYATYLAVAQVFEDTGVRAYKGQAPALLGNKVVLTAALGIHAVEARHASHIRQMRRALPASGVTGVITPWVSLGANGQANDSGVGSSVDASFAGEDNVKHGNVTITDLMLSTGAKVSKKIAVESFDEPLTTAAVLAIANLFIVK